MSAGGAYIIEDMSVVMHDGKRIWNDIFVP
jgi:predicted acyl esterase